MEAHRSFPYHAMADNLLALSSHDNVNGILHLRDVATGFSTSQDNCSDATGPKQYLHASPYITIVSCVASMFGSFLIILTYIIWKDIRTMARAILFFLALADFTTAAGYVLGAVVYLRFIVHGSPNATHREDYEWLCRVQSYVTTVAPVSSFLWTTNLAIYLFITLVLQKAGVAKKMFILFHLTAWGIPFLACTPALIFRKLGPGTSRTSTSWCFVAFDRTYNGTTEMYHKRMAELFGFELLCGKFWELMACIVSAILYVIVKVSLYRRKRLLKAAANSTYGSLSINQRITAAVIHLDHKLIWIPVVFILIRAWGNIRFFISFDRSCHRPRSDCNPPSIVIEHHCAKYLYSPVLIVLQSIGDPAQGWSNALLFVFFSPLIARRLCPCLFTLGEKLRLWFKKAGSKLKGCCWRSRSGTSEHLGATRLLADSQEETSSFTSSRNSTQSDLTNSPIVGPVSGVTPTEKRRERTTR